MIEKRYALVRILTLFPVQCSECLNPAAGDIVLDRGYFRTERNFFHQQCATKESLRRIRRQKKEEYPLLGDL